MPSFSTRVTDHEGGEILEVLCDQKPWGDTFTYDEHFRFGPFKARMIIAAQSVISEFVESDGTLSRDVMPDLLHNGGVATFSLILLGGVIYTLGALVYATKWPNPVPHVFGFHEVFHSCTLVAAVCHYVAIWLAVFS